MVNPDRAPGGLAGENILVEIPLGITMALSAKWRRNPALLMRAALFAGVSATKASATTSESATETPTVADLAAGAVWSTMMKGLLLLRFQSHPDGTAVIECMRTISDCSETKWS